jgi:hypothetical protein
MSVFHTPTMARVLARLDAIETRLRVLERDTRSPAPRMLSYVEIAASRADLERALASLGRAVRAEDARKITEATQP